MKIRVAYRWIPRGKPIKGEAVIEAPDNLGGCRSVEDYVHHNAEAIADDIANKTGKPPPTGDFMAQLETGYGLLRLLK